ncbi:MAG: type II and III secretion system protein family protein [Paracoccaceae bacterium]|nr:type II and III secretion system protein family protein [Paracoccaceae bacterium]
MKIDRFLKSALVGFAVSVSAVSTGHAQTISVMTGETSQSLNVSMNRAVVVESEVPFAELSIANPGIADISTLSDRTIYVLGRAPGRTTLTLLGPDGRLITNVDVRVTPDVAEFKERLRQILPGEAIEVRTANDGIVLSGTVSSIQKLDRALDLANRYAPDRVSNLMMVGGTQQVMLKVRFSEMERSVAKGLNGGLASTFAGNDVAGNAGLGAGQLVPDTTLGTDEAAELLLAGEAVGQFGIGFNLGNVAISALLEALETKGLVRTLAEPNLVALSGQEARFLAGGEYPIPVQDDDGGISVEYKPFGIELRFTPRVVDGDLINLQLNAAVSAIDEDTSVSTSESITINAFRRRETSTVVEMRDGESFAIAGLIEDDFSDAISQVPWLGDVPILGALFRSSSYQRRQSELVVIITAHLVTPTRGEALAMPTDRVRIPTENELFLFGKTVGGENIQGTPAAEVAKQDFTGSYGYVME